MTIGPFHQDWYSTRGGALVSGGASATIWAAAVSIRLSASLPAARRRDQTAAPHTASDSSIVKPSIDPLRSIDRKIPQPISAMNTADREAPVTRPVSSLRASFSSSPASGTSSHAKP